MRTATLGLALGTILIAGACKKKEQEAPKTGTGDQKKGGDGSGNGDGKGGGGGDGKGGGGGGGGGSENSGTTTAGGDNNGTTTGTAASTQKGCVTKLPGAEMPQGDITLTEACGPVTIEGDVTIDAKLTIEPGVTISFVENGALHMGYNAASTLIAKGTADKPITFTSAGDKVPGWWQGIHFYNNNKRSVLEHVVIEHAGSAGDENGFGLKVDYDVKDLTITDSIFRDTKGWGLTAEGEHNFVKLENNKFSGLSVAAMRIHPNNLPEVGANETGDEVIELYAGSLNRSATMRAPHTYRLIGNLGIERSASNAGIPVLTVEPGVTVESVSDAELGVGYNNDGTLKAEGTADKPIKFTGFDKTKGSWNGIRLYSNAKDVVIKNAVVEYARSAENEGAIRAHSESSGTIEGVTFAHLEGVGISHEPASKVATKDLKVDDAPAAELKPPE